MNVLKSLTSKLFLFIAEKFFNCIKKPLLILNEQGTILVCNTAFIDLYHFNKKQAFNQNYFSLLEKNNFSPALDSLENMLKHSSITDPIHLKTKAYQQKPMQWISTSIHLNNNNLILLQGIDIKFEDSFRHSIIDHLPGHFIFWKDKNGVYLGCNQTFSESFGLNSPHDMVGKTDDDLPIKKEEIAAYRRDDLEVIQSKKPKFDIEHPQTLAHGETKTLLTNKIPLFDEAGEVYGLLGVYSDITKLKQNEYELTELNKKLERSLQLNSAMDQQLKESIIDHIPNHFIFWKDINSVFLGCNKAFARSANLRSSKEIIGKTDYDLPWSKEESDAYRADDREIIERKEPKLNIEESQTFPDGTQLFLRTSKVPLFYENGSVYGVLAIYSDITQEKLNEVKLIESNKKLEKSNQVKSEFIRNISHDIRTPLSGIQQTLYAISERKISEAQLQEYAYSAWEASSKLMELFNQVIEISKKENFDFQDRIEKFDLHRLLNDLEATYKIVAKQKNLGFSVEYGREIPQYLLGKHLRLHRILLNLIGNALKFTFRGSVRLLVEKSLSDKERIILRFTVIDTGVGIPKEKQDIIFEPFSRLTSSFQGQYPGSGLGLHVVKEYVEKMEGEIYLESEEGHGSMFTCVLPFKESILKNGNDVIEIDYSEKIDQEKFFPKNKQIEIKIEAGHKKRGYVLLVEDDNLARNMGALILRNTGYQVDIAKTGEEALALVAQKKYDEIFMDIGLPGISGIEATKKIRENSPLNKDTFIMAVTAHADDEIINECFAAGMQKVLSKPLTIEKIDKIYDSLITEDIVEKIIDFELWKNRLGENAVMLDTLFHTLAQDLIINKAAIIAAYKNNDLSSLSSVAHKIKGGLKYCGLPRLEAAIIAIEQAAKNKEIDKVNEWYTRTLYALDEVMKAYEAWEKEHPST